MRRVRISELKAHLSEYLRAAEAGETIVVCDRERAIAALRPWPNDRGGLVIRPATRPVSDLAKIKGVRPTGSVDIIELLDREDRV
ncbi:MAG: type II toxin-antitoxin system prevent-host-death family antitoxin [Dehalococcoidia bacterium]